MSFKRYIKTVFPISGLRWSDGTDINNGDGIIINTVSSVEDSHRRPTADEQKIVSWKNMVEKINATLIAEGYYSLKGEGVDLLEFGAGSELNFKSLTVGDGIKLTASSTEIEISTNYDDRGAIQIPAKLDDDAPSTPVQGEMYLSKDVGKVKIWNGTVWKILRYE